MKAAVAIPACALAIGAAWTWAVPLGHAATQPPTRINVIRHQFPDLYKRELHRTPVSWNHLRRMARERWARRNPCATWTLRRWYRLGAPSWAIVTTTWRCDGMSDGWIDTLACIADHEGGRTYPDVSYGGGRGYAPLDGNRVFGHVQIRPGWYRGAYEGRPGVYAGDYWTYDLYLYARDPVNQARTAERIPLSHYATLSFCV